MRTLKPKIINVDIEAFLHISVKFETNFSTRRILNQNCIHYYNE